MSEKCDDREITRESWWEKVGLREREIGREIIDNISIPDVVLVMRPITPGAASHMEIISPFTLIKKYWLINFICSCKMIWFSRCVGVQFFISMKVNMKIYLSVTLFLSISFSLYTSLSLFLSLNFSLTSSTKKYRMIRKSKSRWNVTKTRTSFLAISSSFYLSLSSLSLSFIISLS